MSRSKTCHSGIALLGYPIGTSSSTLQTKFIISLKTFFRLWIPLSVKSINISPLDQARHPSSINPSFLFVSFQYDVSIIRRHFLTPIPTYSPLLMCFPALFPPSWSFIPLYYPLTCLHSPLIYNLLETWNIPNPVSVHFKDLVSSTVFGLTW